MIQEATKSTEKGQGNDVIHYDLAFDPFPYEGQAGELVISIQNISDSAIDQAWFFLENIPLDDNFFRYLELQAEVSLPLDEPCRLIESPARGSLAFTAYGVRTDVLQSGESMECTYDYYTGPDIPTPYPVLVGFSGLAPGASILGEVFIGGEQPIAVPATSIPFLAILVLAIAITRMRK